MSDTKDRRFCTTVEYPTPWTFDEAGCVIDANGDQVCDELAFMLDCVNALAGIPDSELAGLRERLDRAAVNAKRLLEMTLAEISEENYCAGWMMDLGYDIWAIIQGHRGCSYGMGSITKEQCTNLLQLALDAGGWWGDYGVFIPLEEWGQMYERRRALAIARGEGK
jgi:hypothetical protein